MSAPPVETVPIRLPGFSAPVRIAVRPSHPSALDPQHSALAPPALLLHGLGLSSYSWRHVQAGLSGCRETMAVDLLGFGRGDKPKGADYTLPSLARAVLALMDALKIERTALAGHSLGGGVALLVAVMQPERVERLALIGSVAYPQPEPPFVTLPRKPLAWLPMMLFPRAFIGQGLRVAYVHPERLDPDAVCEYAHPYRRYAGAKAYQKICRALRPAELKEFVDRYPSLPMPVLALHGDRDNVVPRWVPERLKADLPAVDYRLLKGVGHMPLEEEPELMVNLLKSFLCAESEGDEEGKIAAATSGRDGHDG